MQNRPGGYPAGVRDMLSNEEWFDMKDKDRHGITISQVARDQGIDWRTAKKYMQSPTPPRYSPRNLAVGKLNPHKDHIRKMLDQHPYTAKMILETIRGMGYTGRFIIVKDFV